ncbi:glycosyltransferase [Spiribacter vilamensis]|uniref:Glycosyltransferase involved in cell wall biosynthesis n=1 Tax=Spiribacter vilamensis TaxID=531306 RepID=A0A4V2GJA8_9GAMM|nr:glycosyltransferase [Spiribacter vilamensis]RZU99605.1 glycosyltransferase involved in cell wall biosynthesis [Spiribacter vilamensis]TVO61433.1 glycosyltransferase family 4 protein [Spiribacter vilamensis]
MRILFHHPLPLNEQAKSASGIRPLCMLKAFRDSGYQVDLVTGYSTERSRTIKEIKKNVRAGTQYDLVYSESSTMPTALTDRHHLPLRPFMDFAFLSFCRRHGIPIGLFYRDIYWRFDNYGEGVNALKILMARAFYWVDLYAYQKTVARLYLPSVEMGKYVPLVNPDRFTALPPGHGSISSSNELDVSERLSGEGPLRLFYVGGMSSHYQMHVLFEVVSRIAGVELTVCTREAEWQAVGNEYPPLPANIQIIHESGEAMEGYLRAADLAVLFVRPQEYREFAAPVKLYEYLGHRKPIIASQGTLAGRFVEENAVGWTIPYEDNALQNLLENLLTQPERIEKVARRASSIAEDHTWQVRARQVIDELAG